MYFIRKWMKENKHRKASNIQKLGHVYWHFKDALMLPLVAYSFLLRCVIAWKAFFTSTRWLGALIIAVPNLALMAIFLWAHPLSSTYLNRIEPSRLFLETSIGLSMIFFPAAGEVVQNILSSLVLALVVAIIVSKSIPAIKQATTDTREVSVVVRRRLTTLAQSSNNRYLRKISRKWTVTALVGDAPAEDLKSKREQLKQKAGKGDTTYKVTVTTGHHFVAGTTANISLTLIGDVESPPTLLTWSLLDSSAPSSSENSAPAWLSWFAKSWSRNLFARETTRVFAWEMKDVGQVRKVRVEMDTTGTAWFLESIRVQAEADGVDETFMHEDWIEAKDENAIVELVRSAWSLTSLIDRDRAASVVASATADGRGRRRATHKGHSSAVTPSSTSAEETAKLMSAGSARQHSAEKADADESPLAYSDSDDSSEDGRLDFGWTNQRMVLDRHRLELPSAGDTQLSGSVTHETLEQEMRAKLPELDQCLHPEDHSRYACRLCSRFVLDPVYLDNRDDIKRLPPCGHGPYCSTCLRAALIENVHCPDCLQHSTLEHVVDHSRLITEILAMELRCRNHPLGCSWVGKFRDLSRHDEHCLPVLLEGLRAMRCAASARDRTPVHDEPLSLHHEYGSPSLFDDLPGHISPALNEHQPNSRASTAPVQAPAHPEPLETSLRAASASRRTPVHVEPVKLHHDYALPSLFDEELPGHVLPTFEELVASVPLSRASTAPAHNEALETSLRAASGVSKSRRTPARVVEPVKLHHDYALPSLFDDELPGQISAFESNLRAGTAAPMHMEALFSRLSSRPSSRDSTPQR
jgi:hypothetical protein